MCWIRTIDPKKTFQLTNSVLGYSLMTLAAASTHAQLTGVVWSNVYSAFVPSLLPQLTIMPQFEFSS